MKELVEHLDGIYREVFSRTNQLRFNRKHPQQLYCICLYGTVLETTSACLTLLKANECSSLPALLRNLLEAYIDLVNLCRCPDYIFRMQAAFLSEQSRVLKVAIESGDENPYLKALAAEEGLQDHAQKVEKELHELKTRGFGPLRIKERFEKAALTEMYESVYALLCQHSHNNLNILERRHLEISNDDHRVAYFQPWSREALLPYVDTVAGVVVGSLKSLGTLLNIQEDINLEEVEKRLAALRHTY